MAADLLLLENDWTKIVFLDKDYYLRLSYRKILYQVTKNMALSNFYNRLE